MKNMGQRGATWVRIVLSFLLATVSIICFAQRTDSAGATSRLWGQPPTQSSGNNRSGGATLLPYEIGPGSYVNRANYALQVTVIPNSGCYDEGIYVDGQQVARMRDDCEWSFTSATASVPPGSSFRWNRFNGRVTAMSSSGSWEQTQIRFPIGSGFQWRTGPTRQDCPYAGYKMVGTGQPYTTYNYGGTEYGQMQYYEQSYSCETEPPWWLYGGY